MKTPKPWTYKKFDIYPADRNSVGIRWYARTGTGLTLRSGSKPGMRVLINDYLKGTSKQ